MQSREQDLDGGPMCLPICTDRRYISTSAHAALLVSLVSSASLLSSAALLLILSPIMELGTEQKKKLGEICLGMGAVGFVGLVHTGILFFCGTKKSPIPENEKNEEHEEKNENDSIKCIGRVDYRSI